MAINPEQLTKTRRISPRVEVREFTGSTNADLLAASVDASAWPHLCVILTDDQRAGRGRLDRSWNAQAGASLAISVLLDAERIDASARGWIPLIAGLAMTEAINAQLGEVASVKWPNDVLIDGKKICGILAEISGARPAIVVGAGVNTEMTAQQAPVDTATSFAMHGAVADVDALLAAYIRGIDGEITALAESGTAQLREKVKARCATIGKTVRIHLPGGATFVGEAVDVNRDGLLIVQGVDERREVSAGDVIHVR